jgi:hypothetical protein
MINDKNINNCYNDFISFYKEINTSDINIKDTPTQQKLWGDLDKKLNSLLQKHNEFFYQLQEFYAEEFKDEILLHYAYIKALLVNEHTTHMLGFDSYKKNFTEDIIEQKAFVFLCLTNPFLIRNISHFQLYTIIKYCNQYIMPLYTIYIQTMDIFNLYRERIPNLGVRSYKVLSMAFDSNQKYHLIKKENRDKNDKIALSLLKGYYTKFLTYYKHVLADEDLVIKEAIKNENSQK